MRYKPLALAAATLAAGLLTLGGAQAANVITGSATPAGITKIQDNNVQQVRFRRWYNNNNYQWHNNNNYQWHNNNNYKWYNNNNYNNYNHHHHNGGWDNGWGYASGFFLLAPLLYNGYGYGGYNGYDNGYGGYNGYGYGSYHAAGGSRHVRYCLSRYRTYSVRSDTFVGLDGYRHRCRTPYRY